MALKYSIKGDTLQLLECEVQDQTNLLGAPGTMVYMQGPVDLSVSFLDPSGSLNPLKQIVWVAKRLLIKQPLALLNFRKSSGLAGVSGIVGLSSNHPGAIVPILLANYFSEIAVVKGAFLAAEKGIQIGVEVLSLNAGLFGANGLFFMRLRGEQQVFLHGGGSVHVKHLHNESLTVDAHCVLAYTISLSHKVTMVKKVSSMLFGGEGLFLATFTGSGTVWIQTIPIERVAESLEKVSQKEKTHHKPN